MRVQVQKWGNSLGLRIPKPFAQDAGVEAGSAVELTISDGRLIVSPVRKRKLRLKDMLAGVKKSNLHGEWDTGKPVGREIW
ncbi:MAG: AbrB/MazE/SpoVT family DNA-binding domain-containing protein [Acidobacteria bacterium]|nr:AbrB/MazE/SpoVT family DNA-binding domain-containing protein [Acidobacteriota bacterium]